MLGIYLSMLDTAEEKSKFEELHNRYYKEMYGVALSILKNTHDAEDATQEAFLRVARYFSKVPDVYSPEARGYLIIIIKHTSNDIILKNNRTITENIDDHYDLNEPIDLEETVFSHLTVEKVMNAARKLSDNYYNVLFLAFVYEFNSKEIASLLGISYDSAKKRLARAKIKLKTFLEELELI
jgi:RNA polymerase sigma-70 factor (ECF subfamily)